jgi:hypothetical protein
VLLKGRVNNHNQKNVKPFGKSKKGGDGKRLNLPGSNMGHPVRNGT